MGKAKEQFEELKNIKNKISFLEEEKEIIYAKMTVTAYRNKENQSTSKRYDTQELYILKYDGIKEKIYKYNKLLIEKENILMEYIDKLTNPNYILVLSYRYISGLTYSEIAEKMGYSQSHVLKIHRYAMGELENIIYNSKIEN